MKTFCIPLFALCWSAITGPAQELRPTIRILPEDIVQASIKQRGSPAGTNRVAVSWQYTETGARKMLAFRRAHAGEQVVEQIGDFECYPTLSTNRPPHWTEEGWMQSRTDKFFGVSENDARKIIAGFKGK